MWFKRALDLVNIARICKLKWHTPLSGCWGAPMDFSPQSIQNLSRDENIAIFRTLNFVINAS